MLASLPQATDGNWRASDTTFARCPVRPRLLVPDYGALVVVTVR
ncbi:MAG: hypothetical protein ABI807_07890 [Sporichthyaceae bacterium]